MKTTLAKLTLTMLAIMSITGWAADNSIYIDQAGDTASVAISQDGSGNIVRGLPGVGTSSTTPAKIYGDGNQVSVSQVGSSNTLRLGIQTDTSVGASTVNYSVSNSMNSSATVQVGSNSTNSTGNTIGITQSGNASIADIKSIGASNTITVNTAGGANNSATVNAVGDNITGTLAITGGGGNTVGMDLQSPGGSSAVTIAGATNTVNVLQTGGVNGHQSTLDITGSGNTLGVTQTGTGGDNISNLKIGGSGSTITINQNNH
jgi:hypothetical protein